MKKIFTLSAVLTLLLGSKSYAQLSGAYPVPSPLYPTLAAIIADLNAVGVEGSVVINLNADQAAPSGGYVLGSAILNSGTYGTSLARQLTINGKGHILTAPVGSGSADGIFKIQGTDFVTINNLNLQENSANTTATSMMEWGYAVVKRNSNDGVQTLTIQQSRITLNNTNTTPASGVSNHGSSGIFIGNCSATSTAALAAPSQDSGQHAGIFIFQDTIENVTRGIYGFGTAVVIDGTAFNDYGLTIQGNQISNFTHHGIMLSYFHNDLVKSNTINNMASGGVAPTANSIYGIQYITTPGTATNNSWTSETNKIKLTINTPLNGYNATGVATQIYGTGSTRIAEDTIELVSNGGSANLNGIFSQNNQGTQTITKNMIHNFVTAATNTQPVIGIFNGGYSTYPGLGLSNTLLYPSTSTVTNNVIEKFDVCSGTPGLAYSSGVWACEDDNLTAVATDFTGNKVSDINVKATSDRLVGYGGMWRQGSGYKRVTTVNDNTFTGLSATGSTNGTPIYVIRTAGPFASGAAAQCHAVTANNNKVSKITGILGLVSIITTDEGLSLTAMKDTVTDVTTNWHIFGVLSGNSNNGTRTLTINENSFTNFNCTQTAGGAITAGVYVYPGTGNLTSNVTFKGNVIANLKSSDALGLAAAFNVTGGTVTNDVANNMISDIAAAANTANFAASLGIGFQGTGVNNAYYNTVNMVSGTTAATGYGATGIMFNPGGTNTLQNNIVRVNVEAGSDNNVAAMRASAGAASAAPSTSGFGARSNIYYTPTGPNNFLYVEGTTNSSLVNGYHVSGLTANTTKNIVNDKFFNSNCGQSIYHNFMQAASPTRESRTYTENNLSGSASSFAPTGITFAEGAAVDVGSVSDDIKKAVRPGGSSDIGALEFAGEIAPKMNIKITSSTGMDTACVYNLPKLSLAIPGFFTSVSYQWYRDTSRLTGSTGTTITVGVGTAEYRVVVYDSLTGCSDTSAAFKMTIMPPPPAYITYYDALVFCETSSVVLSGNKGTGFTYQWYKDGIPMTGEMNDHIVASTTGEYSVEINTPLGCPTMSAPLKVIVYPLPNPSIFLDGPRILSTQKYFTYQWYRNNIKIDSFANGQRYFVLEDGAYTVEVTDSNGCTAKSTIYLASLGVDEKELSARVRIFPNPSSGLINIDSPVPLSATLSDVTGRIILEKAFATQLDLSPYAEGVYLLNLQDKEGRLIRTEKIVRSR